MSRYSLILYICMVMCTSCVHVEPYAEIGLAYQIDGMSDQLVRTSRSDQCENPQVLLGVGLEFDGGWTLGYHHQSWLLCGKPLGNNKPEMYQDDIRLVKRFGGK